MTRVCLIGAPEVNLRYELLSRETARAALATYDLHEPYRNSLELETVSVGAAVSLLNDLNWYLVRFADDALVKSPSISETEWLSRKLATAVREGDIRPEETDRYLKVYGVDDDELLDPMYLARVDGRVPDYDLYDVDETLRVRVTESEFGE
ncbi:DUF5804 family protein [Haloprofundus salilacus]|uniref:DUF5804 family protein n=1 Tax=Haloprofundus salilacus TaxID=2876190 RepID=UPI001CCA5B2A|nr:DUF5804 family protein [Haloprofundus salilacus]